MRPSLFLTANILLKTAYFKSVLKTAGNFYRFYHRAGKLETMKLTTPAFKEILTPELNILVDIFKKYDHEIRIAGGAVRDLLLDKVPHDIDFATTATPDEMKDMFTAEQIRMINMGGEKHGTITARINDKDNFEVTTLRIDVVTDGRRALVQYTKDWQLDANRRDLTINAMFLGFDGTVYDYFNGVEDLNNRRVRFVGEAETRIQEDYLRILRYFRFYGRIADEANNHQSEAVEAIRKNAKGLEIISGERIWMELKKILIGNHASDLLPKMLELGLGPYMGLPEKVDSTEYRSVCLSTEGLNPEPMTRLSAVLQNEDEVLHLNKRLKMSKDEVQLGFFIVEHRRDSLGDHPWKYCQFLYVDCSGGKKLGERIVELLKYRGEIALMKKFLDWEPPQFPVTGYDLVNKNIPKGPVYHGVLNELRQVWKFSMFTKTKEEILENLDEIIEKVTEKVPIKKKK